MASTKQRAVRTALEYREVDPPVEWMDSETVLVYVSGFNREDLRAQVTSSGKLRVSGQTVMDGNKVSRFEKELHIPDDCDVFGITAKYENEILQIHLPKITTPSEDATLRHEPHPQPMHQPQHPEKHSHEPQHQLPQQEKHSHEPQHQLPQQEKHSHDHEPHPPPMHQLPQQEKHSHDHEPHPPPMHQPQHPEKHSNEPQHQLPQYKKHSHEPQAQLPHKHSHEPQPQLPQHEKHSHEPQAQLPHKHSHEPQTQLPDKHSYEAELPHKHSSEPQHRHDGIATVAKDNVDKWVRETEATEGKRKRLDGKFGGAGRVRVEAELENRKTKVVIVLVVVGALVVGYLSGRLDQAVKDGWRIVRNGS